MLPSCIYCSISDPKYFTGREHVIPESFGSFGSQTPTLKCVCDVCNSYFGRELDTLLARETLEGIGRYKQGKFSKERRLQKRLRITLREGEETGEFGGAVVAGLDATTGHLEAIPFQLQVLNFKTGKIDVFFEDQIGKFDLPEDTYGKLGARKITIFAPSKEAHDSFVEKLRSFGIEIVLGRGFTLSSVSANAKEGEALTRPVFVEGVFDDMHRRALAKILLNFAAKYLGYDEVQKPEWGAVKHYVRFGKGAMAARISDKPFWTGQETANMRYASDSINVRIENHERGLLGVIQFYNQITYELVLIEGYTVPKEMELAIRFTPGEVPMRGGRGRTYEEASARLPANNLVRTKGHMS